MAHGSINALLGVTSGIASCKRRVEKTLHQVCTHVLFVDGCSRLTAGFASMPVKKPILIYEFVFRPALITYGI